MAMLYGANATGKTNILLALGFLRYFVLKTEKEVDKETPIPVNTFALDSDKPTKFEIQFCNNRIVYNYKLFLNRKAIEYESLSHYPKGKEATIFERKLINSSYDYSYNWVGAELRKEQRDALEIAVQNQSILSKISSIKYSGPIQYAKDWFKKTLDPIVEPKTKLLSYMLDNYLDKDSQDCDYMSLYKELLRRADFMIDGLDFKKEDIPLSKLPKLYKERLMQLSLLRGDDVKNEEPVEITTLMVRHKSGKNSYQLDYNEESAGTKRYFEFIGLICELVHRNRVVPIDELESSLHIELQLHFIATFLRNAKKGQLIFTSHNTALLNEKDIIRRDAVWITDRNPDGSTQLTPVSDFPVRKEHAIDRLYRKGLLGGVPKLGSTLLEGIDEENKK
jgi:AAA15 family ATPase/GTPase